MGYKRKTFSLIDVVILTHVFYGFLLQILKKVPKLINNSEFYSNFRISVNSNSNMTVPGCTTVHCILTDVKNRLQMSLLG